MRQITVYKFSELKPEIQKKVHEKVGWRESPWQYENWKAWDKFIKFFKVIVIDYDSRYGFVRFGYPDDDTWRELSGRKLVSRIWRKLRDWEAGYSMEFHIIDTAKKFLRESAMKKGYGIEDFLNYTFREFVNEDQKWEEEFNTFEYFKEDMEINEYEFTETGTQI